MGGDLEKGDGSTAEVARIVSALSLTGILDVIG